MQEDVSNARTANIFTKTCFVPNAQSFYNHSASYFSKVIPIVRKRNRDWGLFLATMAQAAEMRMRKNKRLIM